MMEMMELDRIALREAAQRLYDQYSTVLSEAKLSSILSRSLDDGLLDFESTSTARGIINDVVLRYYPNEATIKAGFIDRVLVPQSPRTISIFELPIGKSRVDMCKVNGHSAAYEIKTDLDTFDRLEGQLRDYFDVFESVYVVTSERRWHELPDYVPEGCGIYSYRQDPSDGTYHFQTRRKAAKCTDLDAEKQLRAIPKHGLCAIFNIKDTHMSKTAVIEACLAESTPQKVNLAFKTYLKQRYGSHWKRFREIEPSVLGIDYEWFYRNGLDPSIVY
ncbi:MAG: sce7726 family protein [Atopobiaceae bacterium]|jgi:hypothetical protein|nr:sce7726 family protein [Atopobiaceae bacterium]MCI2208103.1 sce7726 family protein [Atopobiaceae bacterium]